MRSHLPQRSLTLRITIKTTTLDTLRAGSEAVIEAILDTDATILRLVEMGMTPRTSVVVLRRAPLGDPLEIEVRGTRLCLRRAQAAHFRVAHVRRPRFLSSVWRPHRSPIAPQPRDRRRP